MTPLGEGAYQAALGFVATVGFAVWFNVPRDMLLRGGLVGTSGYLVRWACTLIGYSAPVSSFWAAFAIGLLGYASVRRSQHPRVIFTIPGIIPLVPGIPAYESLIALFQGDILRGLENGVRASLVITALAAGLTAARAVAMKPSRGAS